MKGIIYCIKNQINGKMYIGLTINPKRRKREFYSKNRLYTSKSMDKLSKIDKARIKYGVLNFEYLILETVEKENKEELIKCLDILEDNYITQYDSINNGYNTIKGGSSYIHCKRNKNCSNKGNVSKMDIKLNSVCKIYKSELNNLIPKEIIVLSALKLSFDGIMSYTKLSEILSICVNNLKNIIRSLEEKGFIIINKYRNSYKYTFKDFDEQFELFSYKFLDNKNISFTTKSYIVASQQYMNTTIRGLGKISYSNRELSNKINMPESTIRKCDFELKRKNYLKILENESRDRETGCHTNTKVFNMDEVGQSIIWLLRDHDKRIEQNTEDIEQNTENIQQNTEDIQQLKQIVAEQNKQLAEQNKQMEKQNKQIEEQDKLIKKLLKESNKEPHKYIM